MLLYLCMCLFFKKKKEKEIINSKFKKGDYVHFRYRDELMFGFIYNVRRSSVGKVVYDIQIGGQCPGFLYDINEDIIFIKNK